MRPPTVVILLAVLIHAAVLGAENRPPEFRSTPPLTAMVEGQERIACSAFSINETLRLWMTAAHCLQVPVPLHINGEGVLAVVVDTDYDVAILKTQIAQAPALKLSKGRPQFGDEARVIGYPMGVPMVLRGYVANPDAAFPYGPPPNDHRALFIVTGAKGASGAPIVNRRGEVVSIFQTTGPHAFDNGLVGGVVWSRLVRYSRYFESSDQDELSLLGDRLSTRPE